jgi:hypothetical protein
MQAWNLGTVASNFWRMASGPFRERGWREVLRSIQHTWDMRRVDACEGFDRRFATDTGLSFRLSDLKAVGGDVQALWRYNPTLAAPFGRLITATELPFHDYVFIDLGSGKGRALMLASDYPFRRIVGVELSPRLHRIAERNLAIYRSPRQRCKRFELRCMDAGDFEFPLEPTLLYLFQPFPRDVFGRVLERLARSLMNHPRAFRLVYQNPLFHSLVLDTGLFSLERRSAPQGPAEFDSAIYGFRPASARV